MKITIRKAEVSDFIQINALFREFAEFEGLLEKMTNTIDQMMAEKDFFHCFVAETEEKQIVGYTTHFFCYYTWTGKSLYMDDLYIKQDFRGQGIGSDLINKTIAYAKETGCHKLRWQVADWNKPAIDLYIKLGVEINHTDKNCDLILS